MEVTSTSIKMCLRPKVIKVQGRGTGPFRIIPSVQNSLSGLVSLPSKHSQTVNGEKG